MLMVAWKAQSAVPYNYSMNMYTCTWILIVEGLCALVVFTDNMLKKYIYIGNLPSTATEEELQALFPESNNLAVIVNNDGLPKGYCTIRTILLFFF